MYRKHICCIAYLVFTIEYMHILGPFLLVQQPKLGIGSQAIDVYRSHILLDTHTRQAGLRWTSNRLVAEAANYTKHNR